MGSDVGNLAARLFSGAAGAGWTNRVVLREPDRSWTWAELEDYTRRVAGALAGLGVERGQTVAVFAPDSLEAAGSLLGILYAGAIAVPLNELATPNDLRDYVTNSAAVAAIVDAQLAPTLDEVRRELPALQHIAVVGDPLRGVHALGSLLAAATPATEAAEVASDDVALLLYSAGASDGTPRGVPHSHGTPVAAFESYARGVLGLSTDDRVFSVVRLSTSYGLGAGLLFPLLAGAEAMLLPEQPHSDTILAVIESYAPTLMFATPSVYSQLARDVEQAAIARPLAALRAAVSSAEAMPPPLIDRVRQLLGCEVSVGYGLTQAFHFVVASRPGELRPGACGRPVPGLRARVVGDDGAELGPNLIGTLEIEGLIVSGPSWDGGRGEATPAGWYRTRDRFMIDDDGWFIHCGRVDDLFKVGGKWVSPTEVEAALLAHEAVWEVAVVGADDQDGLAKPLAFVVPNIGHVGSDELAAELREHVKSELAPYKYPRWIEFIDALPKGPSGKVLRYKLQPPPRDKRGVETASQDE